jgi:hypothetical protein
MSKSSNDSSTTSSRGRRAARIAGRTALGTAKVGLKGAVYGLAAVGLVAIGQLVGSRDAAPASSR